METLKAPEKHAKGDPHLAAVLKAVTGGKDLPPEMAKQAQMVWKMLDNMAECNPEEYSQFVKQQAKEAEASVPAEQRASATAQARQKPVLILHSAVLPSKQPPACAPDQTTDTELPVDLSNIVKSKNDANSRTVASVVIPMFEMAEVGPVTVNSDQYGPGRSVAALKGTSIPVMVRSLVICYFWGENEKGFL
jgi:hypothetical protein